jgi:hypothetical protein
VLFMSVSFFSVAEWGAELRITSVNLLESSLGLAAGWDQTEDLECLVSLDKPVEDR